MEGKSNSHGGIVLGEKRCLMESLQINLIKFRGPLKCHTSDQPRTPMSKEQDAIYKTYLSYLLDKLLDIKI